MPRDRGKGGQQDGGPRRGPEHEQWRPAPPSELLRGRFRLDPQPTDEAEQRRAQELCHDAWQAVAGRKRRLLANRALALWPDCADAFNLLAHEAPTAQQAAELFRQAMAAGRRALGEEAFRKYGGGFWVIPQTRPYMRARMGLALALQELGLAREAAAHWQRMLVLNPDDNQGARQLLAAQLLTLGDHGSLERLLLRYEGDGDALWAYTRALHDFRLQRPCADRRLELALRQNPHVAAMLLARWEPGELPARAGEVEQAQVAVEHLHVAWQRPREARAWLAAAADPDRAPRRERELPLLKDAGARAVTDRLMVGLVMRKASPALRQEAFRLWAAFAREEQPQVRKVELWAAAVDFVLHAAFDLHPVNRAALAEQYDVSPSSLSQVAADIRAWIDRLRPPAPSPPAGPELDPAPDHRPPPQAGATGVVIPFPGPRRDG